MATITEPIITPTMGLELYRLNVDEYERLAAAGVLDDPRVELIDGYLVRKMTKKPPRVVTTERLRKTLEAILCPGWYVREEKPVRLPDFDEPEPDLVVARGGIEDYADRHPGPGDVALSVEVAESSLPRDRRAKLAAYARARVPEYWIVNLEDRVLERYGNPEPSMGRFGSSQVFKPEESVPVVIHGQELGRIAAAELFPKRP